MTKVRKVEYPWPEEKLLKDLAEYEKYALELGATESRIIKAGEIIFDPRVRLKCIYPKCRWYGTNAHCPPHAHDPESMQTALAKYRYGVFYRIRVPAEDFSGGYNDPDGIPRPAKRQRINYQIASLIEARAFYEGYSFALGFAGGPCKSVFCPNKECTAIIPGQGCRAASRARSSLEGVGINAFAMAVNAGWDIYPCGPNAEDVPYGSALGMVLID